MGHRQRKHSPPPRKTRRKRRPQAPHPIGAWTRRPGKDREPGTGEVLPMLVEARIETVRLLRAVRGEVPDPHAVPGLTGEVEALEEHDRLAALGIQVWRQQGEPGSGPALSAQLHFLRIGDVIRGEIRSLLPRALRHRVRESADRIRVHPAEIWAEAKAPGASPPDLRTPEIDGLRGCWLPSDANLESWLAFLPDHLIRTIASETHHPGSTHGLRCRRIATGFRDPERFAALLATRLPAGGIRDLARFTAAGGALLEGLAPDVRDGLAPDWDHRPPVPGGRGARLRALGLVTFGTPDGFVEIVAQPQELRALVARALLAHHPDALDVLAPRRRADLEVLAWPGHEPP